MKAAIMSGELKAGEAIPSVRSLAKSLHISILTVQKAYATLQEDGFIETTAGKGCYVSAQNQDFYKVRKFQSPILLTIRNIGVADALVSMLTLQMTMLASFQENSSINADRMNAVTGMVFCVLIALLGIRMICYASKRKEAG